MADEADDIDWTRISDGALAQLQERADLMVQQTVTVALAGDAKAATLAAVFAGSSAAAGAGAATIAAGSHPIASLVIGLSVSAGGFFLASLLCAKAAMPIDFHLAGEEPVLAAPAADDDRWLRIRLTESSQRKIAFNRVAMSRAANWSTRGYLVGVASVIAGVIAGLVTWLVA